MTTRARHGGWIYLHLRTIGIASEIEIGMKGASIAVAVESGGAAAIDDSGEGAFRADPIFGKRLVYTCHGT